MMPLWDSTPRFNLAGLNPRMAVINQSAAREPPIVTPRLTPLEITSHNAMHHVIARTTLALLIVQSLSETCACAQHRGKSGLGLGQGSDMGLGLGQQLGWHRECKQETHHDRVNGRRTLNNKPSTLTDKEVTGTMAMMMTEERCAMPSKVTPSVSQQQQLTTSSNCTWFGVLNGASSTDDSCRKFFGCSFTFFSDSPESEHCSLLLPMPPNTFFGKSSMLSI